MKTLILLLTTTLCLAQGNFKVENGDNLVWEKVYHNQGSQEEVKELILSHIKSNEFTRNIEGLRGQAKPITIDNYRPINSYVTIDVKENKYRVRITDMKFAPMEMSVRAGYLGIADNITVTLDEKVIRKGQLKKNWFNLLDSFDSELNRTFTIDLVALALDDW